MLYHYADKQCLNGWWDFSPLYPGQAVPDKPPQSGYEPNKLLVPSHWNKPLQAVRRPGETNFHRAIEDDPSLYDGRTEWLLDVYGYPEAWSRAKAGFLRRELRVQKKPGKRYFVVLEAAGPMATLFVNGRRVNTWRENNLPLTDDVTDYLTDGQNELAVLIDDYEYTHNGRVMWPFGLNNYPGLGRGILYDAWLVEKDDVYIDDITIRTSVRRGELSADLIVKNASLAAYDGTITWRVTDRFSQEALRGQALTVNLTAGQQAEFHVTCAWSDASLWEPESPTLYWFEAQLDVHQPERERFGFREVWIDGSDIMLNGHPIHLFSDWGHRATPHPYTRGWVQKWFDMLRDMNLNHSRLHTAPHPEMLLDMADEQGILITDETAIFGSGGGQASREEIYWQRAMEHVKRFVQRDKNHPSVILWSCENEMRWNDGGEAAGPDALMLRYLPQIRRLLNDLDPTRPAYHEGDSSCWNEGEQPIISRHYGKECTGLGWWDKTQPLHSGELGLYHYAGPNNTVQFGGDDVWRGMNHVNPCAVMETERLVTDARANGVCALGPWNYSGLLNLRQHAFVRFSYDDYTAPGLKPAFAHANTCEFRYWEEGPGYTFAPGTLDIPHMFRPFAALMTARRTSFRADEPLRRDVTFVNDMPGDVQALAEMRLTWHGGDAVSAKPIRVARGRSCTESFDFDLPVLGAKGSCRLCMRVTQGEQLLDEWTVDIHIDNCTPQVWPDSVCVYGDGSLQPLLDDIGVVHQRVSSLRDAPRGGVLIIERNAVTPGSRINQEIADYCAGGGRVILMEQRVSAFSGIELKERSFLSAFRRCAHHPALDGLTDDMLKYWGDAPYSLLSGDAYVANACYQKDACQRMRVLVDTGEGNFGDGDLESALLFEVNEGSGLIIACQMNITSRFNQIPAAGRLFGNLLRCAFEHQPEPAQEPLCLRPGQSCMAALSAAKAGKTLLLIDPDDAQLRALSQETGIALNAVKEADGTYACVKVGNNPLLDGLSNADMCGIECYNYARRECANTTIARQVLKPVPGLKPLAETANGGLLREMFVLGGSTEILRSYTQSVPRDVHDYVVIGQLELGRGKVIVSMFSPANEGVTRLKRCTNMLLRNLFHTELGESPLAGDIQTAHGGGDGVVRETYAMAVSPDFQLDGAMLSQCAYKNERMNAMPLTEMLPLERVQGSEGFAGDQPMLLYYTIASATPRRLMGNDLALPDPMARTYLDVTGTGHLTLWVNAVQVSDIELNGDVSSIADINIERGFNHILVLWKPDSCGSALTMRWRNIMHEPERGFVFK